MDKFCPSLALQLLHLFTKRNVFLQTLNQLFNLSRELEIFFALHWTQWFYKLWLFFSSCGLFEHFHHSYFGCILRNFLLCSVFFLQMPFGRLFWLELWTLGNIGMISLRSFWFLVLDYQDFLGIWYRPALRLKRKTRESIERLKRDTRGWE